MSSAALVRFSSTCMTCVHDATASRFAKCDLLANLPADLDCPEVSEILPVIVIVVIVVGFLLAVRTM
jgi:hypothetical protein